jgi:hypothetical protein
MPPFVFYGSAAFMIVWIQRRVREQNPVVILGGVMPAVIDYVNVLNDAAALMLIRGPDFLSVFEKPQRDALAMLFLRLHGQEILAAEILWGLWLFPLAILVIRSGFLSEALHQIQRRTASAVSAGEVLKHIFAPGAC